MSKIYCENCGAEIILTDEERGKQPRSICQRCEDFYYKKDVSLPVKGFKTSSIFNNNLFTDLHDVMDKLHTIQFYRIVVEKKDSRRKKYLRYCDGKLYLVSTKDRASKFYRNPEEKSILEWLNKHYVGYTFTIETGSYYDKLSGIRH